MLSALKCICGGTGNPGGRLRTSAANQPDQTRPHLAKTTTVTEQTILKTPAQLTPVREVVQGLFLSVLPKTQYSKNAKTQFQNPKTQFENCKT